MIEGFSIKRSPELEPTPELEVSGEGMPKDNPDLTDDESIDISTERIMTPDQAKLLAADYLKFERIRSKVNRQTATQDEIEWFKRVDQAEGRPVWVINLSEKNRKIFTQALAEFK